MGGLVIFFARLAGGHLPGETLHVIGGILLALAYIPYQWQHWSRVAPFRPRLDYLLGALALLFMVATQLTGLLLGAYWWRVRMVSLTAAVTYPPLLSAAHNIGSMLVLTFVGGHLGAVPIRGRSTRLVP